MSEEISSSHLIELISGRRTIHQFKEGLSKEAIYEALDKCEQGIVIISNNHKVAFWNQWVEKTSNISHDSAIGQIFDNLFPVSGL